jgi:hypothetical protein
MAQKIKWSIVVVLIGVLFCEVPCSIAQIELFDGKARLQFIYDEYLVMRERIHSHQEERFSSRFTVLRHRLQTEGRFTLVENDDLIINFYTWLSYFYEAGPDINSRIHKAMPSGVRYEQYQAPFFDDDDIIMESYIDINYGH